ncbi:MAG TPA: tyrosine-type recombinase/integrase [Candidatus Agathobaculum pullicola]|nr:tyrosine-type recombinase/integrase [Candidatus Agathobaculum pullicola]
MTRNFPLPLDRIGLRHIRFHNLRHSCATLLIEEGASLKEVQDWLGHKNFTLTTDTYAHVTVRARSKLTTA